MMHDQKNIKLRTCLFEMQFIKEDITATGLKKTCIWRLMVRRRHLNRGFHLVEHGKPLFVE